MNIEDDCCSYCFFAEHPWISTTYPFCRWMQVSAVQKDYFLLAYSALGGLLHQALACRETNAEKDQVDGTTDGLLKNALMECIYVANDRTRTHVVMTTRSALDNIWQP